MRSKIEATNETMHLRYPITLAGPPLLCEDRISYHQRLINDAARLFKGPDELDVEILRFDKERKSTLQYPTKIHKRIGGKSAHCQILVIQSDKLYTIYRIELFFEVLLQ